jgi:xylulokinase
MRKRGVLGIDIGTSGCKATVFDFAGHELGVGYVGYEPERPGPDRVEMDPTRWWAAARRAVAEAVASAGGGDVVEAIGISSANATVLVDEDERPVVPAIMQLDRRAAVESAALARAPCADDGCVVNAPAAGISWAANLAWLARHEAAALARARSILFPGGYVALRLTGVAAVDVSRACTTGLCDVRAGTWCDELTALVGLHPRQLPALTSSDAVIGHVRRGVAGELGLRPGTPVVAGTMDSVAAAMAADATSAGDTLMVLGTMARIVAICDEVPTRPGVLSVRHAVPGAWIDMAVLWGAGLSIARAASLWSGTADYARMQAEVARVAPGADGLSYRPPTDGTALAHDSMLTDGRSDRDPACVARAVIEGVLATLVELAPARRGRLILTGGPARTATVPQMLADLVGSDVEVPSVAASEPLGAAMCAATAVGAADDLLTTVARMTRPPHRFAADGGAHAAYGRLAASGWRA